MVVFAIFGLMASQIEPMSAGIGMVPGRAIPYMATVLVLMGIPAVLAALLSAAD